jgi:hypothetical protein
MTQFQSRLSPLHRAHTLLLPVGIAAAASYEFSQGHTSTFAGLLVLLGMFLLAGLFSVRGYAVGQRTSIIKRPGRNTSIDLAGLPSDRKERWRVEHHDLVLRDRR